MFGWNRYGQCGTGDSGDQLLPCALDYNTFNGSPVVFVACGGAHSAAITLPPADTSSRGQSGHKHGQGSAMGGQSGPRWQEAARCSQLWTFGNGTSGQLGHAESYETCVPRLVSGLDGVSVRMVACGEAHTAGVSGDAELFSWSFGCKQGRERERLSMIESELEALEAKNQAEREVRTVFDCRWCSLLVSYRLIGTQAHANGRHIQRQKDKKTQRDVKSPAYLLLFSFSLSLASPCFTSAWHQP